MTRRAAIVVVVAVALAIAGAVVRECRRAASVGGGSERAGGRVERCVVCHARPDESPGGAHAAVAVGCEPCHLGNPLAFDKARAHAGMEPEPGALDTVDRTCGRDGCHPREMASVGRSLMATACGIVSVDRWALGETPSPDGTRTILDVLAAAGPTPAEDHLRRLCAGCHLHVRGDNRDDALAGSASGCAACHATRKRPFTVRAHPPVDARVPDDRCLGCHSRSARISLSYQGMVEVKPDTDVAGAPVRLFDGRAGRQVKADVHHEKGLACIDCHAHVDLMGDGVAHGHEEEQVGVECESCHWPVAPGGEATWAWVTDPIARDLLRLRRQDRAADEPVRLARNDVPLWNLRPAPAVPAPEPAPWSLVGKLDGRPHPVRATPADANHRLKGHERLSCQSCHSAWIPWCADCHVRFDDRAVQWDFGRGGVERGGWVETAKRYEWREPEFALRGGMIVPAAPGMEMDVDFGIRGGGLVPQKLVASWDPHTTRKESRTCVSCHPGFGAGPSFQGFAGTRRDLVPLDFPALERARHVADCLTCHDKAADPIYVDFPASVQRLVACSSRCALPRLPSWAHLSPVHCPP